MHSEGMKWIHSTKEFLLLQTKVIKRTKGKVVFVAASKSRIAEDGGGRLLPSWHRIGVDGRQSRSVAQNDVCQSESFLDCKVLSEIEK